MDDCSRTVKTKTFEDWKLEHADHGEIHDITGLTDPPYMIRRMCVCGAKHVGLREGTYL